MGKEVIKQLNPQIFSCSDFTEEKIKSLNLVSSNTTISDITDGSLKELYEVMYPEKKDMFNEDEFTTFIETENIDLNLYGNWVYYDWRNLLIRIPPVEHYRLLRTARNQLLINPEEQQVLFDKTVLIAGMSVGSNVLDQIIHGGIAGNLIIADMDTLELTNLNRIKTGIYDIGLEKVISAAHKALELDPYLNIYVIDAGINHDSLEEIKTNFQPDVIIDEVDDITAKIMLREMAKELSLPVIMATDNSDGAIIDIERYDTNPEQMMFNNRIPQEILEAMSSGSMPREEAGSAIGKYFVGLDLVDNRLLYSLSQVRKTIPSWPQLGTAASLSGILAAYCSRVIMLGGKLVSDRYIASFDKDMNVDFSSPEYMEQRQKILEKLQGS